MGEELAGARMVLLFSTVTLGKEAMTLGFAKLALRIVVATLRLVEDEFGKSDDDFRNLIFGLSSLDVNQRRVSSLSALHHSQKSNFLKSSSLSPNSSSTSLKVTTTIRKAIFANPKVIASFPKVTVENSNSPLPLHPELVGPNL